jgi:hypothetical protein
MIASIFGHLPDKIVAVVKEMLAKSHNKCLSPAPHDTYHCRPKTPRDSCGFALRTCAYAHSDSNHVAAHTFYTALAPNRFRDFWRRRLKHVACRIPQALAAPFRVCATFGEKAARRSPATR